MTKIRHRQPVEEYLRPQKRFAHLFGAERPCRRCWRASRPMPTEHPALRPAGRRGHRMTMQKPFAITLDPGSSLANKTGSWRTERPVYVDRMPPCNAQCPAGEDIQGWLFHAESGNYEAAWRHLTRDNPFPAIMGRVCYHSCEGVCNRAKIDDRGRHQLGRALPRRRGAEEWLALHAARRKRPASTCWSSAPARRACRRRTSCAARAMRSR